MATVAVCRLLDVLDRHAQSSDLQRDVYALLPVVSNEAEASVPVSVRLGRDDAVVWMVMHSIYRLADVCAGFAGDNNYALRDPQSAIAALKGALGGRKSKRGSFSATRPAGGGLSVRDQVAAELNRDPAITTDALNDLLSVRNALAHWAIVASDAAVAAVHTVAVVVARLGGAPLDDRAMVAATPDGLDAVVPFARTVWSMMAPTFTAHSKKAVGRDTDLRALEAALADGGRVAVLTGVAGVGKTFLARRLCHLFSKCKEVCLDHCRYAAHRSYAGCSRYLYVRLGGADCSSQTGVAECVFADYARGQSRRLRARTRVVVGR